MLFSSLFVSVLSICVCARICFCVWVCLFPPFTLIAFTRICVRACRCVCVCLRWGNLCWWIFLRGKSPKDMAWLNSTWLDWTRLPLPLPSPFVLLYLPTALLIFTHILCPYFSHSLLFCCLVIYLLYFASKNCFSFATGKRSATVELKPWATRARKINFSNA